MEEKLLAEGAKAFTGKGRIVPEKAEIRRLRKELKKVREEGYFKKSLGILKTTEMKHRFMEREKAGYSVKRCAAGAEGIPKAGYYAWRSRQPGMRQKRERGAVFPDTGNP